MSLTVTVKDELALVATERKITYLFPTRSSLR